MSKRHLIPILLLCCALCLTAGILAPGGNPYTEIVIAENAPGFIQLAANDLSKYIGKTCGAELQVVTEYHGQAPAIFVGASSYVAEQGITVDGLASEGYKIVSTDRHLVILGRDYDGHPIVLPERHPWRATEIWSEELNLGLFGEQGSLNGVYAFLKKYAGCRWYAPGDIGEVIQPVENLSIPAFEESDAPVFGQRYIYYSLNGVHGDDMLFMKRNGQGGPSPFNSMHSFTELLPLYKDTHPEFFALIDDKRDFGGLCCLSGEANLCLSNPDLVHAFADYVRTYLDSHPGQKSAPVSPGDGMVRICGCPECQAQIDPGAPAGGKFSNYVWGFVCKVAEEVKKTHPDCLVACAAYEEYRLPPTRIAKFPDNVAVELVYLRDQHLVPAQRAINQGALEGWKKRSSNIYGWLHYLMNNAAWQGLPVGSPENIYNDFQFLKNLGVWGGEIIEAEGKDIYALNNPGMTHWKLYLTMKAHWNPDYDFDAEMDEYYRLFYGPAQNEMRTFWTRAFAASNKAGEATPNLTLVPEDVYSVELLEMMNSCLMAAKEKAGLDTLYAKRVAMVDDEFQFARKSLLGFLQGGAKNFDVTFAGTAKRFEKIPLQRFISFYGAPYSPNTWMRAAHDDKDLILQFICYEKPEHVIKHDAQPKDRGSKGNDCGDVWNDDFIEFFLGTDSSNDDYSVQFAINPNGAVWDARYGIGLFSPDWNSATIRTETALEENRWSLTVRIALRELNYQNFKEGDKIKVNFYRSRYEKGQGHENDQDYSCWSPVFTNAAHCPGRFGTLTWHD